MILEYHLNTQKLIPRLLIVDDEQDVQSLFEQRFRREVRKGQMELHFCFSGEDALSYLRGSQPPDVVLVLSDINMPGMSGLQLLEKIKSEFTQLQVLMVSAYGDKETTEKAASLGADGFLNKPVDFQMLKDSINQIIGKE